MEDPSIVAEECIEMKKVIKEKSAILKELRKELKQKEEDLLAKMIREDLTHIATDQGVYTLSRKITFT